MFEIFFHPFNSHLDLENRHTSITPQRLLNSNKCLLTFVVKLTATPLGVINSSWQLTQRYPLAFGLLINYEKPEMDNIVILQLCLLLRCERYEHKMAKVAVCDFSC